MISPYDRPPLNSEWHLYCDSSTFHSNPSSTASIGVVLTFKPPSTDANPSPNEYLHDVVGYPIRGTSINNNVAEMRGVLAAYQYAEQYLVGPVFIHSDSQYAVSSINNRKMHPDTSLTWSNINAHRLHNDVQLSWLTRKNTMIRLADFAAILCGAIDTDMRWRTTPDLESLVKAFAKYKPRG